MLRVTSSITLLDPSTLQVAEVSGGTYWHHPFRSVLTGRQMVEFVVLDVELHSESRDQSAVPDLRAFNKQSLSLNHRLGRATITVAKSSDLGQNDEQYETISHMGHVLKAGDTVLGYDVTHANLISDSDSDKRLDRRQQQQIVLVRKTYTAKQTNRRHRYQLEQLPKDRSDKAIKRSEQQQLEMDQEEFLRQLEDDAELRRELNVKQQQGKASLSSSSMGDEADGMRFLILGLRPLTFLLRFSFLQLKVHHSKSCWLRWAVHHCNQACSLTMKMMLMKPHSWLAPTRVRER